MQVLEFLIRLTGTLAVGLFQFLRGFFRMLAWIWRKLLANGGRNSRRSGTHGTSRFATRWEMIRSGMMFRSGPILGKGPFGRIIRFTRDGLVMVFASTGAGKGLGIVVPTLLDYRGSMLVTDPKGENYAITRRRRETFGKVVMLNPADLMNSENYNPLDIIRVGTPMESDDAAVLAGYMHRSDAREKHWDDKTISLLTALILHTLQEPPESRTLAHVRTLSVGGAATLLDTLRDIAMSSRSVKAAEIASGFLATINKDSKEPGEFQSIVSNLQKATEVWSSGSPGGQLSKTSTFRLEELVTSVTTIYLCVDEEFLTVYERWLRVMTGCVLSTIMRAKRLPPNRRKVVLLLDEIAVLGPLDPLEKQAGLLRTYCTPVLIWQTMPQAIGVYGHERGTAFLANATARVFFGTNDNTTADYVAVMLGNATILSASQGVSQQSDAWLRQNLQNSKSEGGYWLLDPSEIQRLPVTRIVVKVLNMPFPMMIKRINYRRRLRWWGKWDAWRPRAAAADPITTAVSTPKAAPEPGALPATTTATVSAPTPATAAAMQGRPAPARRRPAGGVAKAPPDPPASPQTPSQAQP